MASKAQILCLQETLLAHPHRFKIRGFKQVNYFSNSPNTRGLCILIRDDYEFVNLDCSGFCHASVEILGIQVNCSLDEPIFIFNIYRHPNRNTPFSFYSNLFAFALTHKFVLFVGDFNAHHSDWEDTRTDLQGEHISKACEDCRLVIMNDGSPTFMSSPSVSSSIIDLSIASRSLALLTSLVTTQDLRGSDHFPISITLYNTHPTVYQLLYKHRLSHSQLIIIQSYLAHNVSRLKEELLSSVGLSPTDKYKKFCSFCNEIITIVTTNSPLQRKKIPKTKIPAPWWNDKCAEASERRSTLCRVYKADPTLANWNAYKRENALCQKVLRREKRNGWRNLCSSFNHKTSMTEVWRFVKAYKTKSLASGSPDMDALSHDNARELALNKLCPPSCLHLPYPSLETLMREDRQSPPQHGWMDDPFSLQELDMSIATCKLKSSPGLDRFDYRVISSLPQELKILLLDIFNEMFANGLFPDSWHDSLIILVPKPNGSGLRPIALTSCLLKTFEKMICRRLTWLVETQFLLPEFQAGFRTSRSCMDNIITLTNRIHWGFMRGLPTVAAFLDVTGAFDNVIPSILIDDLRNVGIPAKTCKFVENLLAERKIYSINNGILQPPLISHKGTPQGSILSPILFNIYLRGISSALHQDTQILQYADDIVLFSTSPDAATSRGSVGASLESVSQYLRQRGLDLAPHKSKVLTFSRSRKGLPPFNKISLLGTDLEETDKVKFLGMVLDSRLSGKAQVASLITKGNKVANVILSLTGVWWGSHPSLLLLLYRSIFRSSLEYGAQIFDLGSNGGLWLKIQRIQYRILRSALGLRQSTPICVLMSEACEPPLKSRFDMLTSRYVYKCFSRHCSSVVRSLKRLEIASSRTNSSRRAQLIKKIPSFKAYVMQRHVLDSINRNTTPPLYSFSRQASIPLPEYHSFNLLLPRDKTSTKNSPLKTLPNTEMLDEFKKFSSSLIKEGISIYTDGSKSEDSPVGAAIHSPELGLALKHRLPADTSIFSAEAWAVYQALILVENSQSVNATIFSDSKSVLDALSSPHKNNNNNYLIPLCRSKYHYLVNSGYLVNLAWVPAHVGIPGNEKADRLAKQAAIFGRKPKFKIPYTDYCVSSNRDLREKSFALLKESFLTKGKQFYSLYIGDSFPNKPWFHQLSIPRDQIVLISRIRSNHYNLNASLFRKNIVNSSACDCGDSYQDINHIIFYCSQTRQHNHHLIYYLKRLDPFAPINIFPFLRSPTYKLCRLMSSFFKSINISI